MTSIRRIGAIAAIGALAGVVALLAGAGAASAQQLVPEAPAATAPAASTAAPAAATDELSQLRANQQLLQQRLDQLEQIAQVGPAHPELPPGTPSIAGSFPRSFLIPGTDTSIQIGGFVEFDALDNLTAGAKNLASDVAPPDYGVSGTATTPLKGPGPIASTPSTLQNGVVRFSAVNSRMFFETRTPTAWGEALTHVEFDFQGCTANADPCSDMSLSTTPALPRLRTAYGTLGGFMAGQNWVPVFDLEAADETFNASGEAGVFGFARTPELGYKTPPQPWMYGGTIGVYAVQPAEGVATPLGGILVDTAASGSCAGLAALGNSATCTDTADATLLGAAAAEQLGTNPTIEKIPYANVVLNWEQPWGHFQLKGIMQELNLDDGTFINKQFLGYGGGFSGNVHPAWFGWAKDNAGFQAWLGDGLGHYGDPSGSTLPQAAALGLATNFGQIGTDCIIAGGSAGAGCYGNANGGSVKLPAAATTGSGLVLPAGTTVLGNSAANAALVRAATIPSWGANANYQHWWTDNLRTNMSSGLSYYDYPLNIIAPYGATGATGNGNYNKLLNTEMVDLIWSPVPFVNTGFEYFFGHRVTVWNQKGNQNEIDYTFIVKF
jgi:hypothetical protein